MTLDCRIVPGTSPDEFIEELRQRVKGEYEIVPLKHGTGPPCEVRYRTIKHSVSGLHLPQSDPAAHVVFEWCAVYHFLRAITHVCILLLVCILLRVLILPIVVDCVAASAASSAVGPHG